MFLVIDNHNARPYIAQKHCIVIVIQSYNDFCNKQTEYVGGEMRSLWKYFQTDIPANQLCMWSSELVGRNERLASRLCISSTLLWSWQEKIQLSHASNNVCVLNHLGQAFFDCRVPTFSSLVLCSPAQSTRNL